MSHPVLQQAIDGEIDGGSSYPLPSWTPAANDFVLVGVATRNTVAVTSVIGNGLSFVKILDVTASRSQCRLSLWRAQGATPSAGAITVNLGATGISVARALRYSNALVGNNGVDATDVTGSGVTGGTDNANPKTAPLNTLTVNVTLVGFFTHRPGVITAVNNGFTQIDTTEYVGTGGDQTSVSTIEKEVTTPATETPDITISSVRDWVALGIGIKGASTGLTTVTRDRTYLWNVNSTVTRDRTYLWNDRETVTKDYTYLWNTLTAGLTTITKDTTYLWNIQTEVTKDRTYLWNIAGAVQLDRTFLWSISSSTLWSPETDETSIWTPTTEPGTVWT